MRNDSPYTPTAIDPGWSWDDEFKFIQAVRVGPMVLVSGQAALDPDGKILGADMETQARVVFRNIEALLKAAGGNLQNVVRIRAYIKDFADYADYNRVRGEMLAGVTFASTTVQISRLYFEDLLLEVDVDAYIPEG